MNLFLECRFDPDAALQLIFSRGISTLTPTHTNGIIDPLANENMIRNVTCQRWNFDNEEALRCVFPRLVDIEVRREDDDVIFFCVDDNQFQEIHDVTWRVFVPGKGFVSVGASNRSWTRDSERRLLLRNITEDDHDQLVECRVYTRDDPKNILAIGFAIVEMIKSESVTEYPDTIDIYEILSIHLDYVILGSAAATSCLLLGAVMGFACLACCMKELRKDVQVVGWQVERLAIDGIVLSRSQYSKSVDLRPKTAAEKKILNDGTTHDREDEDDMYTLPSQCKPRRVEIWEEDPGEEYIDMGGNVNFQPK